MSEMGFKSLTIAANGVLVAVAENGTAWSSVTGGGWHRIPGLPADPVAAPLPEWCRIVGKFGSVQIHVPTRGLGMSPSEARTIGLHMLAAADEAEGKS